MVINTEAISSGARSTIPRSGEVEDRAPTPKKRGEDRAIAALGRKGGKTCEQEPGWARYEELKKINPNSRVAFITPRRRCETCGSTIGAVSTISAPPEIPDSNRQMKNHCKRDRGQHR